MLIGGKLDIHVIYGGMSTEHEISLRSAKEIINNLDKTKYNVSYTLSLIHISEPTRL